MSDSSATMDNRRKYLNYTTPVGITLTRAAQTGCSAFLIHESGYQTALEGWNHEGVDSPFWRFYHNPRPGCHLRFQGREVALEPGSCVLIPANTIFDCCGPVTACHSWLHFTVTHSAGLLPQAPVTLPMDALLGLLTQTVLSLHGEPPSDSRDQRLYHNSAALLHAAFARIEIPADVPLPERLQEVLALIHRAPHAELSNPFLASRAGMSVERFIRAFRAHTGMTPAAYVSAGRVRQACEALALTDKSIDQIAVDCGFPNRHYFSRVFAQQLGCGPAEFRARQHRRRGI